MAKEIDKDGWSDLDKILDYLDHFQTAEEEKKHKEGKDQASKYRHLLPDIEDDDISYF